MSAFVFINTPITSPLRLYTIQTRIVLRTIIVCEVSRHEIFVCFGGPNRQRHKYMIMRRRNWRATLNFGCRTGQAVICDHRVDGLCVSENAFIFRTRGELWQRPDCQLNGCHLVDWDFFGQDLLEIDALLPCAQRQPTGGAMCCFLAGVPNSASIIN